MDSRAYTAEEIRDMFMSMVRDAARYWANLPDADKATGKPLTIAGRCEGVAFSILSIIDGSSMLPAFDLVAVPHVNDKRDAIEQGDNWIEPGTAINECMLHELFASPLPRPVDQ